MNWRIASRELRLIVRELRSPKWVLCFGVNGSETQLPSDKIGVLLIVWTFTGKRWPIVSPLLHECQAQPIRCFLAKIGFNETPVPARFPAVVSGLTHGAPQIPGGVPAAFGGECLVGLFRNLAPEYHPACMVLGLSPLMLLLAFRILDFPAFQLLVLFGRFQSVIDCCEQVRLVGNEGLQTY